jgi:hypothetical protein
MSARDFIAIKPHHFIDILTDLGRGKTDWQPMPSYGHALHMVARRLMAERDAPIQIELGIDHICRPCVHNVGGACDDGRTTVYPGQPASKMEWNMLLDRRWCKLLGLRQGQRLTAMEFCRIVARRISLEEVRSIYPEPPAELVEERCRNLLKGLATYCGDAAAG